MITGFCTTKRLTRKDQDDLIELIKTFAGPEFESWNVSHYRRSKVYNPPRDKMISHFFCENLNCRKIIMSRSLDKPMKKNTSIICAHCEKNNLVTVHGENQFMSIDVKYQLEMLLNDPCIQEDLLQTVKNVQKNSADPTIRDVYNGALYNSNLCHKA